MSWRIFFLQVFDPEEEQNEESAVVVTDEKGQKMQASGDEVTSNLTEMSNSIKLLLVSQILIISVAFLFIPILGAD